MMWGSSMIPREVGVGTDCHTCAKDRACLLSNLLTATRCIPVPNSSIVLPGGCLRALKGHADLQA